MMIAALKTCDHHGSLFEIIGGEEMRTAVAFKHCCYTPGDGECVFNPAADSKTTLWWVPTSCFQSIPVP